MIVSYDEIKKHLETLAALTEENKLFTRKVFTPMYEKGRDYIINHFKNLGLNVIKDDFANILAIKKGKSNECILIGSHSDTVEKGGRFDGILGVVAAMEIARVLQNTNLDKTLIFCDFLGEEPNEYGLSCVGSRGLAKKLSKEQLNLTVNGTTLSQALVKMGGNERFRSFNELNIGKAIASFELHIEQGNTLESINTQIGIVNKIVGIARFALSFHGSSNHAGTTAMHLRKDALVNTANFITWLNENAINYNKLAYTVATVGKCEVLPNAANVIPNLVNISIDLRSEDDGIRKEFIEKIHQKAQELNATSKLIADSNATLADDYLINILKSSADEMSVSNIIMPSGAGHDSAYIANFSPMGMVFIPSKDGLSHHQDEFSSYEDCTKGTQVILNAILKITKEIK